MDFFVNFMMAPIIFMVGLIGNLTGIVVLSRKQLEKIGPVMMYRTLFIMDTIYLLNLINFYLSKAFDLNLSLISNFSCKLSTYISYSFSSFSALTLMYISFYRFIAIRYPAKSFTFKKIKTQFIFIFVIVLFELAYYSPAFISFNLVSTTGNDR